jgi:P27 family predicted phage terminase small subunit
MAGRPPKPTALKKLAGNPGKRALNTAEPQFESVLPKCPTHLKKEARREWKRVVGELFAAGLLTSVDRAALAAYCQAWARWVEAEKQLAIVGYTFKTENGYQQQSPWVGIANSALENIRRFAVEFGMTPSSRSRVKVQKPQESDPFEEWARKKLEA